MKELENLLDTAVRRVSIKLRKMKYDVAPAVYGLVSLKQLSRFYASYAISTRHPLGLEFKHSSIGGSHFLGKCRVAESVLYKSDVRGDELKKRGDIFRHNDFEIALSSDETIEINGSLLVKALVHNFSHDPESPALFFIRDTAAAHYSNIHGSPCDGCFLEPFATVDLTTARNCIIGAFSYVQTGEIGQLAVKPGTIWIKSRGSFEFIYRHEGKKLKKYISFTPGEKPRGVLMDTAETTRDDLGGIFDRIHVKHPVRVPQNSSLDRYAAVSPETVIGQNVLVSQRALLKNAQMGRGANAQENCCIINSCLEGENVTAHGAKIIDAKLGRRVFVGFNSLLRGLPENKLVVGKSAIIMPHTIIDAAEPLAVPAGHLVWGIIKNRRDMETNTMPLDKLAAVKGRMKKGRLSFEGSGAAFVSAFKDRIHHILEANGAFFDGVKNRGHAQKNRDIAVSTLQPYSCGRLKGIYPTITVKP
ncbi:MAG: transferase [Desulfococcus sp. 4484_241]|nr:MAG: transferase [Desulfococcus sp. 4484_241]